MHARNMYLTQASLTLIFQGKIITFQVGWGYYTDFIFHILWFNAFVIINMYIFPIIFALIKPWSPPLFFQLISVIALHWEYRKGVHSSGVMFFFWLFLVIFSIFPLRSYISQLRSQVCILSLYWICFLSVIKAKQCNSLFDQKSCTHVYISDCVYYEHWSNSLLCHICYAIGTAAVEYSWRQKSSWDCDSRKEAVEEEEAAAPQEERASTSFGWCWRFSTIGRRWAS